MSERQRYRPAATFESKLNFCVRGADTMLCVRGSSAWSLIVDAYDFSGRKLQLSGSSGGCRAERSAREKRNWVADKVLQAYKPVVFQN